MNETPAFSNPAAVLYGVNDMRYEDHALPETVAPGHVRVAIKALGICGSDVHFFKKVSLLRALYRTFQGTSAHARNPAVWQSKHLCSLSCFDHQIMLCFNRSQGLVLRPSFMDVGTDWEVHCGKSLSFIAARWNLCNNEWVVATLQCIFSC